MLQAVSTAVAWFNFAVTDTIGAAGIAAVASLANTLLIVWSRRRIEDHVSERRIVVVRDDAHDQLRLTPAEWSELGIEDNRTVIVQGEERRRSERRGRRRRK